MPRGRRYFEAVTIGEELPALVKPPVDRVQLARYAGATQDFNRAYVDEAFAKSVGMPSVMAPGSLGMGFLAQLVTDWAPGAQVARLSAKFVRTLWPQDTLTCRGRVADMKGQGGRYFVDLDVWGENQQGGLVLRGQARVKLFYSQEDEARALAGRPPLVVNTARSASGRVGPGRSQPTPRESAAPRRAKTPARSTTRKSRSGRR